MCILLPNYSVAEAVALAERVRREIEAASATGQGLKVTASLGVAGSPTHAMTATDLIRKADEAVYEAKDLGRNLVRVSGEPRPTASTPHVTERRQPETGGITEKEKEEIRARGLGPRNL
jgi:predicted signal transduction protein with EAL and GGDEF domain